MHTEIQIMVVHNDKYSGDELMGEVTIVFKDIVWDVLRSYKLHTVTSDEPTGEIDLSFMDSALSASKT